MTTPPTNGARSRVGGWGRPAALCVALAVAGVAWGLGPAAGAAGTASAERVAGEALLAVPSCSGVGSETPVEFAPRARLLDSFWSRLLCATVARVGGPEGMAPEAWLRQRPGDSELVPHSVYVPAAVEIRPFSEL